MADYENTIGKLSDQQGDYSNSLKTDTSGFNLEQWMNYAYGFNPYSSVLNYISQSGEKFSDFKYEQMLNIALQEQANRKNQYENFLQTDYNSDVNRVARMRKAGLNPDLQGISDSNVASASSSEAGTASVRNPSQSANETISAISGLMGSTSSVLEHFMNIAPQVQQIIGNSYENDFKELTGQSMSLDLLQKIFNVTGNPNNVRPDGTPVLTLKRRRNQSLMDNAFVVGSNQVSRMTRQEAEDNFEGALKNGLYNGLNLGDGKPDSNPYIQTLIDIHRMGQEVDKKMLKLRSKSADNDLIYQTAYDPISAAQSTNKQNSFNSGYYGNLSGSKKANYENASFEFGENSYKVRGNTFKWYRTFMDTLNDKINDPNTPKYEKALLIALSMSSSSIITNGLPSIGKFGPIKF